MPSTKIRSGSTVARRRVIQLMLLGVLLEGCSQHAAQLTPVELEPGTQPRQPVSDRPEIRAVFGSYDQADVIAPQRAHSLYVSKEGRFFDIGDGSLGAVQRNSHFADDRRNQDQVAEQLQERIALMLARIDAGPVRRQQRCSNGHCSTEQVKAIVIFVHGGLRTVKAGIGRTTVLMRSMLEDDVNPVFINWRSGFFTTYWDHLWRVRQGTASSGRRWQLPFTLLSDVLRTIANVPTAWASEAQHSIETWRRRKNYPVEALAEQSSEDAYVNSVDFANREAVSHVGRDLLWWLTGPAKALSTPLVYTLGKPPWDIMRTRALSTATERERFPQLRGGIAQPVTPSVCWQPTQQCRERQTVSIFLQALQQHVAQAKAGVDRYEITLVGHSMGAIVANDALRNNPGFPLDRIVHMASADSVLNTMATLAPYLSDPRHDQTQYYSLSLHPNNEDRETRILGMAPSGSLLVWIDNMYTSPATSLERTAGRFENFADFIHLIPPSLIERFHFKVFDKSVDRRCDIKQGPTLCEPQRHDEFSEGRFWNPAFYWREPSTQAKP